MLLNHNQAAQAEPEKPGNVVDLEFLHKKHVESLFFCIIFLFIIYINSYLHLNFCFMFLFFLLEAFIVFDEGHFVTHEGMY